MRAAQQLARRRAEQARLDAAETARADDHGGCVVLLGDRRERLGDVELVSDGQRLGLRAEVARPPRALLGGADRVVVLDPDPASPAVIVADRNLCRP